MNLVDPHMLACTPENTKQSATAGKNTPNATETFSETQINPNACSINVAAHHSEGIDKNCTQPTRATQVVPTGQNISRSPSHNSL